MHDCWETLGIAPTQDLREIRRAYAQRLRLHRPDEDPEAYQRLRAAFDAALALAARMARPPEYACEPERARDPPLAATQTQEVDAREAPAASSDTTTDTEGWEAPQTLARAAYAQWKREGDAALVASWPRLLAALDRVPLTLRDEASGWFARLVLECETLPLAFVRELAGYFGWGRDFRVDDALGAELAVSLQQQLRARRLLRVVDAQARAQHERLLQVAALRRAGRRLRAGLLALLSTPKQLLPTPEPLEPLLYRIGIDSEEGGKIEITLHAARLLRGLLFAALVYALLGASTALGTDSRMFTAMLSIFAVGAVHSGSWVACALFDAWAGRFPDIASERQPPTTRRLACCAGLAFCAALLPPPAVLFGTEVAHEVAVWRVLWALTLSLAALLALWSTRATWRALLLPLGVTLTLVLWHLPGEPLTLPSAIGFATLWLLAAQAVLLRAEWRISHFYRHPLRYLTPGSVGGWVVYVVFFKGVLAAMLVIWLLLAPLTLLAQERVQGGRMATAALVLVVTAGKAADDVALTWVLGLMLLPPALWAVQSVAESLARRRWLQPPGT